MPRKGRGTIQSVDFDTDANVSSQLDEKYDDGLSLFDAGIWSSKGPSTSAPRVNVVRSAMVHGSWAWAGWTDGNQWTQVFSLAQRYAHYTFTRQLVSATLGSHKRPVPQQPCLGVGLRIQFDCPAGMGERGNLA